MNKKIVSAYTITLILVGCVVIYGFSRANGSAHDQHIAVEEEFKKDEARLNAVSRSSNANFHDFVILADQLDQKWRDQDHAHFARIMDYVCKIALNCEFVGTTRDQEQDLSRKYSSLVFSQPGLLPLDTEVSLVETQSQTIKLPTQVPDGKVWVQDRLEDAKLWLHVWQRLDQAYDPTIDPAHPDYPEYPPVPRGYEMYPPPVPPKSSRILSSGPSMKRPERRSANGVSNSRIRGRCETSGKKYCHMANSG